MIVYLYDNYMSIGRYIHSDLLKDLDSRFYTHMAPIP